MSEAPREVACPTCGRAVPWTPASRWRPFCSERCKLIDLGEWLSEEHRIAGEPADPPWQHDADGEVKGS
jgi:endogenous inhibitor of DNA gyrase (YacG/DUF329 family)